nr:pentapeptide repeat-containing protein [uncultured Cohaesibacter sp.]
MENWYKRTIGKYIRSLSRLDWRYELDTRLEPFLGLPYPAFMKATQRTFLLLANFFWWLVALIWIGSVAFIILSPERASDFDIFETAAQWHNISGSSVDASTLLRNLGWLLITAIGLPVVIWRSFVAQSQANIAQMGQHADRFAKAASMLSDESRPVREAGIFALRELAIANSEGYYFSVQDLLCSFIRDAGTKDISSHQIAVRKYNEQTLPNFPPAKYTEAPNLSICSSDIAAALRTFSDLRSSKNIKKERDRNWTPDLRNANFKQFHGHNKPINLQSANLGGAVFAEAVFEKAIFRNAHLPNANFRNTCLELANFQGALLHNVSFVDAYLYFANLRQAKLKGAKFERAVLHKALFEADELKKAAVAGAWFPPPIWRREMWPGGLTATETRVGNNRWRNNISYFSFAPSSINN